MASFNIHEPSTLATKLRPGQRLIGVDPGRRRIGLALSDVGRRIASPHSTIARARLATNAAQIGAIAQAEDVGGMVIGYPLEGAGQMGAAAQAVRDWARALSEATGLPAALWDESLTTADSHAALIAADIGRQRRAVLIDKLAAARILQGALDAMAGAPK